jgi:peptidyl-prolyl cis-trans isomerase B (cyclophilin B)
MITWTTARRAAPLVCLLLAVGPAGCGKQSSSTGPAPGSPTLSVARSSQPGPAASSPAATTHLDPRLHQPFAEAVLQVPPGSQLRPPDVTCASKSVGKLYEAVLASWDQIKFQSSDGKHLAYTARIQTDLGTVVLQLWPEVAPNHVRSFIALARAGYYDGLNFDRVYREEVPQARGTFMEYVEAGCPLGTGEPGYGSIGYWLKPELSPAVHHEEGTVGAWHAEEQDSAACKFYIILTRAPWMDGNFTVFGKVVQGLDVVRRISARPRRSEDPYEDRPLVPVVIRQVTIQCQESAGTKGPAS